MSLSSKTLRTICLWEVNMKSREEVIKILKELNVANDKHWEMLNNYGYLDHPIESDPYSFQFMGETFDSWHEASDVAGAVKICKILFDIKDEELQ